MGRRRTLEPEENVLRSLLVRVVLLFLSLVVVLAAIVSTSAPTRDLLVPVRGATERDLFDSFRDPREGGRLHEAIDISAPFGTPVLAADDGIVHRLFTSERGGIGLYLLDRTRERCFFYGHLARYSRGMREGYRVGRGEVVGFVGSTGNASEDAPHLHFAVLDVSGNRGCSSGTPLDPFPLLIPAPLGAD
jgi:peptidoglycan LD-endopeptidase LytH